MPALFRFITSMLISSAALAQGTVTSIRVPYPLCTGTALTFSAVNNPTLTGETYSWMLTPGATLLSDSTSSTITYSFSSAGNFLLRVSVRTGAGTVVSSAGINIPVTRTARAVFSASLSNTGFPATLELTNFSTNSIGNSWIFNDDLLTDTSLHTRRTYTAAGSYSVTLVATGRNGCHNQSGYSFYISDSSGIRLPNIFTPNGDGVNDVFRPLARGISSLRATVYDRHGLVIASWDRVNGWWDGYTTSGQACDDGVYFVTVEASGFDGRTYRETGNITLLR